MDIKSTKRELSKRIAQLNSRVLRDYSKISSIVHYQDDRTKTSLKESLRYITENTKRATQKLKAIERIVTHLETIQNYGDKGIVDLYYKSGSEEIKQFIRMKREEYGWTETDILIVLETSYGEIERVGSTERLEWLPPTQDEFLDFFEGK